jgi:hypothetical protein
MRRTNNGQGKGKDMMKHERRLLDAAKNFGWVSVITALLLAGCSAKYGAGAYQESLLLQETSASMDRASGYYNTVTASGGYEAEGGEVPGTVIPAGTERSRKLIHRADLRIRVQDLEAVEKPVLDSLEKYGAYSASTYISETSRSYAIRVPSASYGTLLAEIAGIGKVLHRSESAEDVTLKYYDLDARLTAKQELLKIFQAYLGKAANIEEIMTVETRIAELQNEIEWTGTELKHLADLVDYASINLDIVGPVNVSSYSKPSLPERIVELFGLFGDFASAALLILIGFVIFGIPCILVLVFLFWLLFGKVGLIRKLFTAAAWKKQPIATLAGTASESPIPEQG